MSSEHLSSARLDDLARLAQDAEPAAPGAESPVDIEALFHLTACSACRARLAAASSALARFDEANAGPDAGADDDLDREDAEDSCPLDDLEDVLEDFLVVDLELCDVERSGLSEARLRTAASPTRIASIGPARDRARAFRSTDEKLRVDVREDSLDDACYVYLLPEPDLDRETVRLYVPPGLVKRWPESGYFRYPRYTFDAVDWSEMKLLYPRRLEG